jgi:hypothetical protein
MVSLEGVSRSRPRSVGAWVRLRAGAQVRPAQSHCPAVRLAARAPDVYARRAGSRNILRPLAESKRGRLAR